jgi:type I restriction enzyme, S subunit
MYKNSDLRLDSEFYQKSPYEYKLYEYVPIKKILESTQYGISIEMNENKLGTKIYRMNEIHNMLADIDVSKYADISLEDRNKFKLIDRDVLFNRTNSFEWVGRTGLFKNCIEDEFVFASYLIRLIPNKRLILPEFLTAFLNSNLGIWDIKRRARISINQSNVNAEEVKEIMIPLMSIDYQNKIKELFDSAHSKRLESIKLYNEAIEILLEELDLKNFSPSEEVISTPQMLDQIIEKGLRFDSEYYLPKYEDILKKIKSYKFGFEPLYKICNLKDNNYVLDTKLEYEYIELSNIGVTGDILGFTKDIGLKLPTRARRIVKNNDVIISSVEGSIDKVALVTEKNDNNICSTGFYVISSEEINSETLLVLFKNKIFQDILIQNCSGTILTAINKTEFINLPIPKVSLGIQKLIKEKIRKSFSLKERSIKLLEIAQESVNIGIEKNEENAFKYIKENADA